MTRWLTRAQAAYLLVTGDLEQAANLPEDVGAFALARLTPEVIAHLPADPTAEEVAAGFAAVREKMSERHRARDVLRALDSLLASGNVAALGRRTPTSPLEPIAAAEFCALRWIGDRLGSSDGRVVFWGVRLRGDDVLRARRGAIPTAGQATGGAELAPTAPAKPAPKAPAEPPYASRAEIMKALRDHGRREDEAALLAAVKKALPGKKIPRRLVRPAIKEAFGSGRPGRKRSHY